MYCVLGAQVNVPSSIVGDGGRAKEAQSEFLVLLEDAIGQPDLVKSVQRYQLTVDEAKVGLDLAVAPGVWLMPSRKVIDAENSHLQQKAQAGHSKHKSLDKQRREHRYK